MYLISRDTLDIFNHLAFSSWSILRYQSENFNTYHTI
jgi:hypothetical protein